MFLIGPNSHLGRERLLPFPEPVPQIWIGNVQRQMITGQDKPIENRIFSSQLNYVDERYRFLFLLDGGRGNGTVVFRVVLLQKIHHGGNQILALQ